MARVEAQGAGGLRNFADSSGGGDTGNLFDGQGYEKLTLTIIVFHKDNQKVNAHA